MSNGKTKHEELVDTINKYVADNLKNTEQAKAKFVIARNPDKFKRGWGLVRVDKLIDSDRIVNVARIVLDGITVKIIDMDTGATYVNDHEEEAAVKQLETLLVLDRIFWGFKDNGKPIESYEDGEYRYEVKKIEDKAEGTDEKQ